ncbi:membrane protein [Aureimonas endophytica]|uniref:Membrane protein n=1 Tax=Aureimonas endophytica TaxID=2027858 RepID=A0A917E600_9HYPH|nr:MAPEG family protein [Aureimonas endophytica]GGE06372.1 membrane protein [Aureimonas endophytica]
MLPMPHLPIELTLLAWSVVLLVVHIGLQGQLATRERGTDWNAGPRDGEAKPLGRHAARAERALSNFQETYPAFVAAVLIAVLSGRLGWWSTAGAWLWFLGRIVYLPLYIFGIPYIRSLVWLVSLLGIVLILFQLT